MKKNLKYLIFFILIMAVALILQWSNKNYQPKTTIEQVTGQNQGSINIKFSFSETESVNFNHSYAENLSANLLTITQGISQQQNLAFAYKDYGELGVLVTKIGDKTNGQDQKYWQFFVNNEQPMESADKFIPKNGDQIEWRFAESKF